MSARNVTVRVIDVEVEEEVPVDRIGDWIAENVDDGENFEIIDRGPDE